ncbi:unnamed protein product [Phytophthora fragariaefolia]|uniref:Unnamed protein product n=1 Tax=Phytophthora fragariaefolia TaxID=1490495 RepID=A0A9W6U541_9STRA|nr:unnamed protein product [Phytophthora fragariaefolia]
MTNWKMVVKRVKYGLNGIQQVEVENSIKQIKYSTTTDAFNRARDGFEIFCKGECPNICKKHALRFSRTFKRIGSRVARCGLTVVAETTSQQGLLRPIELKPTGIN